MALISAMKLSLNSYGQTKKLMASFTNSSNTKLRSATNDQENLQAEV